MKMKLSILILPFVFFTFGCKKDGIHQKNENRKDPSSATSDVNQNGIKKGYGKFKEEIVVTDKTGMNKAFFAIHSDDESLLSNFIDIHDFSIELNNYKKEDFVNRPSKLNSKNKISGKKPKKFEKPEGNGELTVELVFINFKDETEMYSLSIDNAEGVNTKFNRGSNIKYVSGGEFLGCVYLPHPYPVSNYSIEVENAVRENSWNFWNVQGNSVLDAVSYATWNSSYPTYHGRRMKVWADQNDPIPHNNYEIVYEIENFRNTNCKMGNYDPNNYGECYVGTVPSGTTPFIMDYGPGDKWFYYTPINGNQCPYTPEPGSGFDGWSCKAFNIPDDAEPYTWSRNLLVKSDRIL